MGLNCKQLRLLRRSWDEQEDDDMKPKHPLTWLAIIVTALFLLFAFYDICLAAPAPKETITTEKAILAIMGEGEDEPYMGKIALAKTIINRGHLGGVYGGKSVVVKDGKYYKKVSKKSKYFKRTGNPLRLIPMTAYLDSKAAWEYAVKTKGENDWSATGWGSESDVKIFIKEGWWKNCIVTAKVGNHIFYREKKGV